MKIIATSEMTIYDDLKKICDGAGVLCDKKIALKIEIKNKEKSENKKYEIGFKNIIFQSKNAVKFSKNIHSYLLNNKKSLIYCIGKYTMTEIKKYFKNEIRYPESNYSSESLLDLIKQEGVKENNYLIVKGEDGRDYLEKEIKKHGGAVQIANVYRRVPIKSFISEEDLMDKDNNYLIVSSRIALNELVTSIIKFRTSYNIVLVVPNNRVSENIQQGLFKDIIVICNSSDAKTYANIIGIHNEKN